MKKLTGCWILKISSSLVLVDVNEAENEPSSSDSKLFLGASAPAFAYINQNFKKKIIEKWKETMNEKNKEPLMVEVVQVSGERKESGLKQLQLQLQLVWCFKGNWKSNK